MQVTKSVYIVSGASYDLLGNVYAIRGERGVALVDSGESVAAPVIEASLARWGMDGLPVTHLFLTHGHMDHAGCAAYFQKKGAKIAVQEGDAHWLREGGFQADRTPYGEGWIYPPCEPDIVFREKQTLEFEEFRLKAYPLPGHTDGSTFYEMEDIRERTEDTPGRTILFTGDTFSFDRERDEDHIVLCWKGSPDYDPVRVRKSLEAACQMFSPDVILSGHGMPLLANGNEIIRAAARKFLDTYR
ncbi:MAG: MBL fold metallo-hydrolase [Clostridia bacterium]|nr:MBL fold metallo-hydrolase [Clostridia bacterium]